MRAGVWPAQPKATCCRCPLGLKGAKSQAHACVLSLMQAPREDALGAGLVLSALPAPPCSWGMLRDRAALSLAEGGPARPPVSRSGLGVQVAGSLALTLGP